jgi:hypothetical protein
MIEINDLRNHVVDFFKSLSNQSILFNDFNYLISLNKI